MSRKPRSIFHNGFFHIVCQGLNKEFIFSELQFKNYYLKLVYKYSKKLSVTIIAYCIMDNHVHLLLYCNNISDISHMMKSVNALFASFYNKFKNRVGYVFKDRFYSELIRDEKHLYCCIQYIHMNPVKANIVSNAENYPFSSCRDYIYQIGIISDRLIELISNKNENYLQKIFNTPDSLYSFIDINFNVKPNKEISNKIIENYLKSNHLNCQMIKNNKSLLKDVCYDLINFHRIRQSYISNYFNISKSKINRISN